ncbi:MAG: DNA primase small subunit domain-containing protein [Thermoplasmata archaeon]
MGKTVALGGASLDFARRTFLRYYQSVAVEPPPRFARREFAAFPFAADTTMRRHMAFRTTEEFGAFLAREGPRHVYYSSAYYRVPDHPKMPGKEWLGADLIFDLDADHLRESAGRDYAGQLELVKARLVDLLDDFLVGDFGLDPTATSIVFSGGRGYHVHIRDEKYLRLTSPERREIVDYILGTGVDVGRAILERRESDRSGLALSDDPVEGGGPSTGASRRTRGYKRLAPPDAPGWTGRTTRAFLQLLERWDRDGAAAAAAELERFGVARGRARSIARQLVDERRGQQIRDGLSLEVFHREVPKELLEVVLREAAIEVQGETDAPVTTDIHRLIRLPGSLHGGTGFCVRPLTRDALDGFEPLRDAVAPAPAGEEVDLELSADVRYPFPGRPIEGAVGDRVRWPTPVALFLLLRGEAVLPPAPA